MADRVLRRYTDVLSLLDIVRHNRLTLLDPSRWFDQNDALGLKLFSQKKGEGRVYALCLADGGEQAHHWQIFAGHSHGLCIHFDRERLINHLNEKCREILYHNVWHRPVIYENLKQVKERRPIALEDLPFLKRDTFKAEEEYRIVAWQDEFFAEPSFHIPLPAGLIERVTFGPTMPDSLARTVKEIAAEQPNCSGISFSISRLVNNQSWREAITTGMGED